MGGVQRSSPTSFKIYDDKMLSLAVLLLTLLQGNLIYSHDNSDSNIEHKILLDEMTSNTHPCKRTCVEGQAPMTCQYTFNIEYYLTMSKACYDCPFNTTDCLRPDCIAAEGSKRGVVSINRQIPGPKMEVCLGDLLVIDVINQLSSESTTMHWHGQHQRDSTYVDGVPYVTQCPILPHDTFRYKFNASQPGTFWYHSHIGMQRADGNFGPLIVRIPDTDNVLAQYYDYDLSSHIMMISDWDDTLSLDKYLDHIYSSGDNKPRSMIINGLGRNKKFTKGNETFFVPTARFTVEQGYRYRFRILNSGVMNCPIELSIDNHTFWVISTDGNDIVPIKASSLVLYSGERFDIIVSATQPDNLYWIRVKGHQDCGEDYNKVFQVAVLEYKGIRATIEDYPKAHVDFENAHIDGVQINGVNRGVESNKSFISMPDLESLNEWDISLTEKPDIKYVISFDFEEIDNSNYQRAPHYGYYDFPAGSELRRTTPQLNHISLKMPNFALLPQRDQIPDGLFCNRENMVDKNCTTQECLCYHGIQIPLDSVVEVIFIDEGNNSTGNHPMHLHGYTFRVVAMEKLGENITVEEVQKRDDADGGYTIIRFHATNPGYWILHCHLEFHAEMGMAMLFQVGEKSDMLPVPDNFPTCGDYSPDS
ncbi:hypothetical protein JTB14_035288 [Gonioctena quinquepunctata]|nr:hypothetical protein JTB14_035288 [Gonioctena quinquepunctata]